MSILNKFCFHSVLSFTAATVLASSVSFADTPFTIADSRFTVSKAIVPSGLKTRVTNAQRANAKSRMPLLEAHQLPAELRRQLGLDKSAVSPSAYGSDAFERYPYTTKRAAPKNEGLMVMQQQPFASTGQLWAEWDDGLYVCSASVIDKGLIVTAAHCLVEFGTSRVPLSVWFEPARHGEITPFGRFNVSQWVYASSYGTGTDVCDPQAPGIVCENDLAIGVVDPNDAGKYVKNVVGGKYGVKSKGFNYVNLSGETRTQVTSLGYPCSLDNCQKMIRTDSLGTQMDINQVVIGTDQTGGSSGGPWLANFGISPERTGDNPVPTNNASNSVIAVSSWGYVDPTLDIQGASRFDNNTQFPAPGPSNIQSLVKFTCMNLPSHCK